MTMQERWQQAVDQARELLPRIRPGGTDLGVRLRHLQAEALRRQAARLEQSVTEYGRHPQAMAVSRQRAAELRRRADMLDGQEGDGDGEQGAEADD